MNTNDFIDALEHELRLASRRRVRLAVARVPRPPAGALAFAVALVVCAAVAVPLLATRSSSTVGPQPSTVPPSGHQVVVGCASAVYGQLGRDWRSARAGTVVAGPLAWVAVRGSVNPVVINRSHFIKALAVVNPGAAVTVTIPASERGRLSLDYTSVQPRSRFYVSQGVHSVTFRPCARATYPGGVSQFAGGFIVSGPQCAEVDIVEAEQGSYSTAHSRVGTLRLTNFRRFIPLGRPCPRAPNAPARKVLSGDGIGRATFGESPNTVVRRLDALLGQRPSGPYYKVGACRIDHGIGWPGLIAFFHRGRFVGYSDQSAELATLKGLKVGDALLRGRRLYGSAFMVGAAQGGNWSVKTPQGWIDGYTTDVTNLHGKVTTIEAGDVGCPAMTP